MPSTREERGLRDRGLRTGKRLWLARIELVLPGDEGEQLLGCFGAHIDTVIFEAPRKLAVILKRCRHVLDQMVHETDLLGERILAFEGIERQPDGMCGIGREHPRRLRSIELADGRRKLILSCRKLAPEPQAHCLLVEAFLEHAPPSARPAYLPSI